MQDEQVEIHDNVECCVVHPTGQLQTIKECWCKLYHVFGQNIESQDIETLSFDHFGASYHCAHLSENAVKSKLNGQQLALNIALQRRLFKQINGPGIIFQRGCAVTQDQCRKILLFQQ
jgi:hypothetical protein